MDLVSCTVSSILMDACIYFLRVSCEVLSYPCMGRESEHVSLVVSETYMRRQRSEKKAYVLEACALRLEIKPQTSFPIFAVIKNEGTGSWLFNIKQS